MRIISENKGAFWRYDIKDKVTAGIALTGGEVKSIKEGRVYLNGSFVKVIGKEAFLVGANIPLYKKATDESYDPERPRKLLLHREEISRLVGTASQKGYTILPLQIIENYAIIKLIVGVGKGRKEYEKKEVVMERQEKRDTERLVKELNRL
ncbi:SsrA-binding protein [candidate division WWE3 bacterium CG08_land_8_20_14_0_20_41_15]|uniref:SsrA-binding protein n=1 Tax=candidate division WWE3 bacterium CG08_land_8_20_14_0_20_41_15 TaxID=1975086 RepID=A0A2H0X8E5_UNCKA|nr:MAG: SsrA-binding protein [candidate division WWE3 bacterium CG08_land_8_20_14_0_20_41_15]